MGKRKNGEDMVERVIKVFEGLEVNDRIEEEGYDGNYSMFYAKVANPRSGKEICRIELKPYDSFKPIGIVRRKEDLEELEKFVEFLKNNMHLIEALERLQGNRTATKKSSKAVRLV